MSKVGGARSPAARSRRPWLPPRWLIVLLWHGHRALVRVTSDRPGLWRPKPGGWEALLLTTTGRRTGRPRPVILGYFEDGRNLVTTAMNGWGQGFDFLRYRFALAIMLAVATAGADSYHAAQQLLGLHPVHASRFPTFIARLRQHGAFEPVTADPQDPRAPRAAGPPARRPRDRHQARPPWTARSASSETPPAPRCCAPARTGPSP